MNKLIKTLSVAFMAVLIAFSAVGCSSFIKSDVGDGTLGVSRAVIFKTEEPESTRAEMSVKEAYEAVAKTSVAILVETGSGTAAGSGVIVDMSYEDGGDANSVYILTCHHVISSTGNVTVTLPDDDTSYENADYVFTGKIEEGKVPDNTKAITLIGGDQITDIAVLKLDLSKPAKSGKKLSADKIVKAKVPSDSYKIETADAVFAVGNPTGELPGTFSHGYISKSERIVSVNEVGEMNLMQIDVSTNHGNSGGGLYNLYGELVGITNAGNDDYDQINFAIPFKNSANTGFVRIAGELLGTYTSDNYGYVEGNKEKFGFTSVQKTDTNGDSYVYVGSVTKDSLAYKGGLLANDVITKMSVNDGKINKSVTTVSEVTEIMSGLKVGDRVTISGTRIIGWRQTTFSVTLTAKQFRFCNTGK